VRIAGSGRALAMSQAHDMIEMAPGVLDDFDVRVGDHRGPARGLSDQMPELNV
jgi:hypothetical protein